MTREFKNRLGVGLFIVVVATTAIAILPKSTTNAQQVAQPPDRKALRSKIVILRGELALLELEFEADRESLKPKLFHEPELSQIIDLCRQGMKETPLDDKSSMRKSIKEIVENARTTSDNTVAETLSTSLKQAAKIKDLEASKKAIMKWLEGGESYVKAPIEKQKNKFVRTVSNIVEPRLELEDLEKQYRNTP